MKLDNRIWVLLTALVSIGVLAGAWFLGVSPALAAADASVAQVATVQAQNKATQTQIASLKASQAKKSELDSELADLKKKVPSNVDGSAFIARIQSLASSTGVTVKAITLDSPAAYAPVSAPSAEASSAESGAASGASATATPAPSDSASATAAPVPTGPAAPAPSSDPMITAANFVLVPVSVEVIGPNANVLAFLDGIQHDDRLFLVTKLLSKKADSATGDSNSYDLTASGSIYVLLDPTTPAGSTSANG